MAKDEDFSQDNVPASNWMKFQRVGDYVKGTFSEKTFKPGQGDFKDQVVYHLVNCEAVVDGKKTNEKEYNVGISSNYVNSRFNTLIPGQRMGIKFDKEIAAKIKGHHNAKSLLPNVFGMDPNYKGKEVFKKDIDFE
jgi:hypothetical protein